MKLIKELSEKYGKEVYDCPQSGFFMINNRYVLYKKTKKLYDARYNIDVNYEREKEMDVSQYIFDIRDELLKYIK